jgi:hypothetical protein
MKKTKKPIKDQAMLEAAIIIVIELTVAVIAGMIMYKMYT